MFILKATEFIFKIYECNLKAYEYILNHTNVFWTYNNISIYNRIVYCNMYYIRQLWRSIVRCSFTVRCLFGTWSLLPPDSKLSCTHLRYVRWPSAFGFFVESSFKCWFEPWFLKCLNSFVIPFIHVEKWSNIL